MAMDPATAKVVVGLALRLRGLLRYLLYGLAGIVLLALLLIGLPLVVILGGATGASASQGEPPSGPDGEMIGRYETIYKLAAAHYEVNWYLLASIHRQESNFSRLRGRSFVGDAVSHGWNRCGAAGPMQMGIVGVAPYHGTTDGSCSAGGTWTAHRAAFAPIAGERPPDYPQQRTELAACRSVPEQDGCVYDDFDAIAAAAHKLRADGATPSLYSNGTFRAVCSYIGSCSNVENCGGPNDYCQVLPRARVWEAEGAFVADPPSENDWLAAVPGFPGERCDRRIVADVLRITGRYGLRLNDCFGGRPHALNGEHPLGLAVDLEPRDGNWNRTLRLATDAGWLRSCASTGCPGRGPFRVVLYNGFPGHGDPSSTSTPHLHLSWEHGDAPPFSPAPWVRVLQASEP